MPEMAESTLVRSAVSAAIFLGRSGSSWEVLDTSKGLNRSKARRAGSSQCHTGSYERDGRLVLGDLIDEDEASMDTGIEEEEEEDRGSKGEEKRIHA